MEGLERIVLEHPFFAGLGPGFGAAISGCARNLRFGAGQYLFREDESANEFYLIRHGAVALELHSPGQPAIVIATLREGDILDSAWLVPPYRWSYDARATELIRVLGVNAPLTAPTARTVCTIRSAVAGSPLMLIATSPSPNTYSMLN